MKDFFSYTPNGYKKAELWLETHNKWEQVKEKDGFEIIHWANSLYQRYLESLPET